MQIPIAIIISDWGTYLLLPTIDNNHIHVSPYFFLFHF
jgi:hypothetical protein